MWYPENYQCFRHQPYRQFTFLRYLFFAVVRQSPPPPPLGTPDGRLCDLLLPGGLFLGSVTQNKTWKISEDRWKNGAQKKDLKIFFLGGGITLFFTVHTVERNLSTAVLHIRVRDRAVYNTWRRQNFLFCFKEHDNRDNIFRILRQEHVCPIPPHH